MLPVRMARQAVAYPMADGDLDPAEIGLAANPGPPLARAFDGRVSVHFPHDEDGRSLGGLVVVVSPREPSWSLDDVRVSPPGSLTPRPDVDRRSWWVPLANMEGGSELIIVASSPDDSSTDTVEERLILDLSEG